MARLLSLLLLVAGLSTGCASLQPRADGPVELALPAGDGGVLDRAIAPVEARNPGRSGFRLVTDGEEAFVTRAQSARLATRSLDVQAYIWHTDLTGLFLAQQVVEAADRGVRVRLLLDDMDARAMNAGLAVLAAHPNISVRLFNPFVSRSGTLALVAEGFGSFGRVNRRMHNKTWIADNRLAIVGGRNLGDEYFAASDAVNFVDLDFSMIGPVVRDVSASFDRYWNSASAYPIGELDGGVVSAAEAARVRELLRSHAREAATSRYAKALQSSDAIRRLAQGDWPLEWSSSYRFVSDDPGKATTGQDEPSAQVAAALLPLMRSTTKRLTIISPYFVPGRATADLVESARAPREVRILTNSLVANDVAAVHGGYSRYRGTLLEGGVQIWELKPVFSGRRDTSLLGSKGASLHTKALAVDGRSLFVGSYNLDPRSTWLNCEQGVIVDNDTLARQFESIFEAQANDQHAWRVTLQGGALQWSDGASTYHLEPEASAWRRFQAWMARLLRLDPLL